jgi:predicted nucleotidyltransferase
MEAKGVFMNLFPSERAAIDEVISRTRSGLPSVRAISVFGSRARGASAPESDLDIALHVDGERRSETSREVAGALEDLFAEYGFLSISTVFDRGVDPLRDAIKSEEVVQWKRG